MIDYIDGLFLVGMLLVAVVLWLWSWIGALGWLCGLVISGAFVLVQRWIRNRQAGEVQP